MEHIFSTRLTPDAVLVVEDTGNVVLVTPERRITITNVDEWRQQLAIAAVVAMPVTS